MTVNIQFLITNVLSARLRGSTRARSVGAWTCCWVFTGVDKSLHRRPGRIALWTKGNSVTGFSTNRDRAVAKRP
jgi:hypothetical protein